MPNLELAVAKLRQRLGNMVAAYVFGSHAAGTANRQSDLDLAVLCSTTIDPQVRYELLQDLSVALSRDVDLIDLAGTTTVMRAQVVAGGKRIFCADATVCDRFEDLVFSSYARLNEERREILRDVKERESVYG
jgi:predicted nucleotidyltransferase